MTKPNKKPPEFVPLEETQLPKDHPFFVVIPTVETFTEEERAVYESGRYPMRVSYHLPEHENFGDYLIERSVAAWTRSKA